jgi:hypothetical protein
MMASVSVDGPTKAGAGSNASGDAYFISPDVAFRLALDN